MARGDRAAFISRLRVGAKVMFVGDWCPTPVERTITKVQANSVAFTHPTREGESWLTFPKASEVEQPEPGHFFITDPYCKDIKLHYYFDGIPVGTPSVPA